MKRILKLRWLVVVVLTMQLRAAELSSELTIDELVRKASSKNPELNFYRAEIAAARAGWKTASAFANPVFTTQAGYKNEYEKSGAFLGDGPIFNVAINQTFEYPGRIALRKAIASRDSKLAELGYEQFRAGLLARVRVAAFHALIAQEKMAAVSEVTERLQKLASVLHERAQAGPAPQLEARIIEIQAFTLQHKTNEATVAAKSALLELAQLCGLPKQDVFSVAASALSFPNAPRTDALIAAARTNAFELRIQRQELEQQGLKVSLAKNERYPAISVGPFYAREEAGDTQNIAGLEFSLPLPLWNRNAGNIDAARAREQQAQASLAAKRQQIERRVAEAAATLATKIGEMNTWPSGALQRFRETADAADQQYRLGAVPLSTYVELQRQHLEAVENVLETKKEALQAALELEILTGARLYRIGPQP